MEGITSQDNFLIASIVSLQMQAPVKFSSFNSIHFLLFL